MSFQVGEKLITAHQSLQIPVVLEALGNETNFRSKWVLWFWVLMRLYSKETPKIVPSCHLTSVR